MICIEKDPVLKVIDTVDGFLEINKHYVAQRFRTVIIDTLRNTVNNLPEIDPQSVDPADYKPPVTEMVEELVSMAPYSKIGAPGYFCANCKTRVKKKDCFCRKCGYKFEEDSDDD